MMTGRLGGLKSGMTHVLVFGALGLVVSLAALGRKEESEFRAAPDDPDHARHCVVCQSPNHFGGLMPGPAPSNEVLSRMIANELGDEADPEVVDRVSEDEMLETADGRKVLGHGELPKARRPFGLQTRGNASKPSAS